MSAFQAEDKGSIPLSRTLKAMSPNYKINIPKEVEIVIQTLKNAGFEAFLVGGCVRDMIMGRIPKDWDVTTNAKPEQIISLFEKTVYENTFGTVGVCIPKLETLNPKLENIEYEIIEVTPYRLEGKYTDSRHPDSVSFSENILDDLKRRDFTMNSIAFCPDFSQIEKFYKGQKSLGECGELVDPYNGIKDIDEKFIRTVGEADDRFGEDALRMLRAIRFSCELGFTISKETLDGVIHSHEKISQISKERIRDEFEKIIMSKEPALGVGMLQKLGLIKYFIPELEEGDRKSVV